MNAKTIFITGANRGLGLQFVRQLLKLETPPQTLIATCRDVANATELKELAAANKSLKIMKLDVEADCEEDRLIKVVEEVHSLLGGDQLNLIINNAGRNTKGKDAMTKAMLTRDFTTNVFAPVLLTKALQPFLVNAAEANKDAPMSCSKAGVVNISSIMASITKNEGPGSLVYKTTKAALNMATKSLAHDLGRQGIICLAVHPGWVQTDMGGSHAPVTPEQSISGMLELFAKCGPADTGKFLAFDGEELPW